MTSHSNGRTHFVRRNIRSTHKSIYDLTPAVIKATVNINLCRELHRQRWCNRWASGTEAENGDINLRYIWMAVLKHLTEVHLGRLLPLALTLPHQPSLPPSSCINPWIVITSWHPHHPPPLVRSPLYFLLIESNKNTSSSVCTLTPLFECVGKLVSFSNTTN